MTPEEIQKLLSILEKAKAIFNDRGFKGGLFRPLADGRLEILLPEHPEKEEPAFLARIRELPIKSESVGNLLRFDGWCRAWILVLGDKEG